MESCGSLCIVCVCVLCCAREGGGGGVRVNTKMCLTNYMSKFNTNP